MTLDEFFGLGKTVELGAHRFGADEIKAFARKFDPQPFHMDEKAAEDSLFGKLCASGWHTASMWMKYNLLTREDNEPDRWTGPGRAPIFGPSPGFKNMRWPKPVYVDETVRFSRRALAHRPVASRPGWRLLTIACEGHDSTGAKVIEFDSAVLVDVG